jgi:hypothetical protein
MYLCTSIPATHSFITFMCLATSCSGDPHWMGTGAPLARVCVPETSAKACDQPIFVDQGQTLVGIEPRGACREQRQGPALAIAKLGSHVAASEARAR